jgi:hypothetical protein
VIKIPLCTHTLPKNDYIVDQRPRATYD